MPNLAVIAEACPDAAFVDQEPYDPRLLGLISIVLLGITSALLVADLHKPARFLYILFKPNTDSWLVRGAWILIAHGALSALWVLGLSGPALAVPSRNCARSAARRA